MARCWWLYLLVCRDGRTYVGIAIDVAARFAAHSSGKGAKFTRSNPPVRVLGARAYASKSEALKAEAALKKLDRPERLAWAESTHEENAWPIRQDENGSSPESSCSG
jgi:putative endonuclease